MDKWYTILGVIAAALLSGAALGAFWVEGLKKSLLRMYERRKRRNPDAYDQAIFWAWISGAVMALVAGLAIGLALDKGALAVVVLTLGATIGGLGSKVFYDKVIEPSIRALETRIGIPAAPEDE
jgi:hypothetical protein